MFDFVEKIDEFDLKDMTKAVGDKLLRSCSFGSVKYTWKSIWYSTFRAKFIKILKNVKHKL